MALLRMLCPVCSSADTYIRDVRHVETIQLQPAHHLKRRRECRTCDHRWTTREIPVEFLEPILAKAKAYDEFMLSQKVEE